MKKIDEIVFKYLCWVCAALLFSMMGLIFVQVLARYVFQHSLTWSEEVGRFIFVWITFLGMPAAFRSGAHVALDLLERRLVGFPQKALKLLNCSLVFVVAVALFFSGLDLYELGTDQASPALNIPMHYVYSVFPIGSTLLIFFACELFLDILKDKKENQ